MKKKLLKLFREVSLLSIQKILKMKYDKISSQLFIKNRAKFSSKMKDKTLAVFNSNDIYPISADSTIPFQQHRDIFYLSGVDQEESILIIFPTSHNESHREILFLKERE